MHIANLSKTITSPAMVLTDYWTLVSQYTTLLYNLDSIIKLTVQSNQKLISTLTN